MEPPSQQGVVLAAASSRPGRDPGANGGSGEEGGGDDQGPDPWATTPATWSITNVYDGGDTQGADPALLGGDWIDDILCGPCPV